MGRVFQRHGRPGWYFDYWDEGGKRCSKKGGRTKREARASEAAKTKEIAEAKLSAPGPSLNRQNTVLDLCHAFIERPVAHSTRRGERPKLLGIFVPYVGASTRPKDLIKTDFLGFARMRLDSGRKPGTVFQDLSTLRNLFNWAMEFAPRFGITENPVPPARRVPAVRKSEARRDFLTPEQMQALLTVTAKRREPHLYPLVTSLLYLGARFDETRRIERGDINLSPGQVWFSARKSRHGRYVPLENEMRKILAERLRSLPVGEERVFVDSQGRLPSRDQFGRAWRSLLIQSGIPYMPPHSARHTAISHWVMAGVPLAVIQQWAGHESIQTTMRYAHLCPRATTEGMGAVESWRGIGCTFVPQDGPKPAISTFSVPSNPDAAKG